MKQFLIFATLFFIVQGALSQVGEINQVIDKFVRERSSGSAIDQSKYSTIAGTPYMNEAFTEGEVIINDTIHFGKVPLRYNVFTDKMEFKNKQDRLMEIDYSAGNFSFLMDEHQFKVMAYQDKGESKNGHLELLVDGEISLYRKYNTVFEKKTEEKGFQENLPDRFVSQDPTYLIAAEGEMPETISRKKDLLQKLNQDDPKVAQYLKDNKLRMRSDDSIIDLITFYNNAVLNNQ
jgi:hypothetical protein